MRYGYLITRDWTEKEKVSRRRAAQSSGVEDRMAQSVTFSEATANIVKFFSYPVPPSIFL